MSCGCACGAGGTARAREQPMAAPLPDLEKGLLQGSGGGGATGTPAAREDAVKEMAERAARRIVKFIVRGLLILLGTYLFDYMKRYAVDYIGGETWFSTFAAVVVAVPMAEILCILGQSLNHCIPQQE